MKKYNKSLNYLILTAVAVLTIFIIINPDVAKSGASIGILLCGRVIITSLFPFTFCVLYIMKSGILNKLKVLTPLTKRLFSLDGEAFSYVLLSMIAGYPVGARLLNEAVKGNRISAKKAGNMLCYSINGGPAFIISAVGAGILGSNEIGFVLFAAHLLSSLILCVSSSFFDEFEALPKEINNEKISPVDIFIASAADASSSVLGICGYVILFSTVNSFCLHFSDKFPFLKLLSFILEATNAVTQTKNVYLIALILGFGGICVLMQVVSNSSKIKINYIRLFIFRILHGILGMSLTFVLLKIFKISLPAFSFGGLQGKIFISSPALGLSMLLLGVVFAVSITSKKSCKLSEDVI